MGTQRYFCPSASHKTFHFLFRLRHRNDRMELNTFPSLGLKIKISVNSFGLHQITIIIPKDSLLLEIKAFHFIIFHNSIVKKKKKCKVYEHKLCVYLTNHFLEHVRSIKVRKSDVLKMEFLCKL